ncbi:P-loop containing nucleoside triphosphate hydrolase protein [Cristinia sonorae]|uniref:P-loop containing nucleoside triphosphate hydrolase protein n=1 Tax=Cristinia sonorae TaxID=1940300 RepID=A0A8K0UWD0_9AGAR|nr:P-loop containing nucleoside triphosphate hydrolase protein [Cristinia sonorae]
MAHTAPSRRSLQELEDAFIKVSFEADSRGDSDDPIKDPFYEPWFERGSGKFSDPTGFGATALRKLYPNYVVKSIVNAEVLGLPGTTVEPVTPADVISQLVFVPLARRIGDVTGVLTQSVRFGLFHVSWRGLEYLLYVTRFPAGFGESVVQYVLHDGPAENVEALVLAAGMFEHELHEEIFVFNQGWWSKDPGLWREVQKANWNDVILKDTFKIALQNDVRGFFASEDLYKALSIPWKRGLIMYGPPGNGKTISMKAIMKECDAKGYTPLYVRSFQSWMGEEASMSACFAKARQMAPCVLVLEDLDSLINNQNRSFFLNELDGLEDNDGLLIIGTTNHFEMLDPALSGRPSRFDRKYSFDDPDKDERALYAKYWQHKLKSNKDIDFPDSLVDEIAAATEKFSFAYLKEAFVSTLVLLAGKKEDEEKDFKTLLKGQIKTLRDQLDHSSLRDTIQATRSSGSGNSNASPSFGPRDQSALGRFAQSGRFSGGWNARPIEYHSNVAMPGGLPDAMGGNQLPMMMQGGGRDVRSMAKAAASLGRSFIA